MEENIKIYKINWKSLLISIPLSLVLIYLFIVIVLNNNVNFFNIIHILGILLYFFLPILSFNFLFESLRLKNSLYIKISLVGFFVIIFGLLSTPLSIIIWKSIFSKFSIILFFSIITIGLILNFIILYSVKNL